MSLSTEILTRLSSQSVGSTASTATWRLVVNEFQPATSSQWKQILIQETGGLGQIPNAELLQPTFQVQVRSTPTESATGSAKLDDVITALNLANGTHGGRVYVDIQTEGGRLWLGRDDNNRPIYGQNFSAWRSRTT